MDRPGVRQVPEGSGEQGKIEETGCEIICGAPTTLAVKGLMMMIMMMMMMMVMMMMNPPYTRKSVSLTNAQACTHVCARARVFECK